MVESKGAAAKTPAHPVTATQTGSGFTLENGLVRVRINAKGQLASVYDLKNRREVLSGNGNVFRLHEDIPNAWSAWDVDIFHKEKYEVLDGVAQAELVESGPLRATVKVVRSFGKSRLEQRIVLRADSARIDFPTEVEWQENQKFLKVAFPVAIRAMNATYEIQYGHLERPTHSNTSWDMARFEVCAQKWADLSESGYGVALLNDCKYGHDIHGNEMCLSLLRAPTSPDPLADRGQPPVHLRAAAARGRFPRGPRHRGSLRAQRAAGRERDEPSAGSLPATHSFFQLDRANVIIEAIKLAEDGGALIVRLYEAAGARGSVSLTTTLPVQKAWRADLMENDLEKLPFKNGKVRLDLNRSRCQRLKISACNFERKVCLRLHFWSERWKRLYDAALVLHRP